MEGLELKVGLLVDETGKDGEVRQRLYAQEKELVLTKRALEAREADAKEKAHNCGCLELE